MIEDEETGLSASLRYVAEQSDWTLMNYSLCDQKTQSYDIELDIEHNRK